MSDPTHTPPGAAVFLSYAREDAEVVRRTAEALRAGGIEVWFDQNELRGGDAWDQKIRGQIRTCTLFVPVISASTQQRGEGYFRREWRLAVERTHDMAAGLPFLVPVVIDETREGDALVPEEFMRVQWTRLPGGAAPPEFVAQVKRLLETPRRAVTGGAVVERGGNPLAPPPSAAGRRIPVVAWLALPVVVAAAFGIFFALKKNPPANPGAAVRPPTAEKPAAPVSEARQLVAKARALYEPWDLASRDDFNLAEQLLKKAVDLDPTDGDAWGALSVVSAGLIVFNYDSSSERRDAVRNHGERAAKLAPDSDLARFARALSYRFRPASEGEAARLLREEAERQPTNKFVVRMVGSSFRLFGRYEESLKYLDRVAALPGGDAIAEYNRALTLNQLGRMAESEAAIDRALELMPTYGQALGQKIHLAMTLHGDLPKARELAAKMPASFLLDDRGAAVVSEVWLLAHEPNKCIESLAAARDYMQTNYFTGPKTLMIGLANRMAGRPEAARADWRTALQLVEQRLAAQPNLPHELAYKALLLALLGEQAPAEQALRVYEQVARKPVGHADGDTWPLYAALGRNDEVIKSFSMALKSVSDPRSKGWLALHLRRDPFLDPLRTDERFKALLAMLPPEKP